MRDRDRAFTLQHVELTLDGEPVRWQIFPSVRSAVRHLEDHFFSPTEDWAALLPRIGVDPATLGFGDTAPPAPCQIPQATLVHAYEAYVRLITEALRFGAVFPMHLHERRQPAYTKHTVNSLCFISLEGVIVYASGGAVRSAFIPNSRPNRNRGPFARFAASCDYALARATRGPYVDTKNGTRWDVTLAKRCTDEHWALPYWNKPRYVRVRNDYL